MKTNRSRTPFRLRKAGSAITLLVAWALLACLPAPLQAYVIDDFEHGRRFMLYGMNGVPEWELMGGELRFSLPGPFTDLAVCLYRQHVFELPEGQPVEFSLDLVSANRGDVFVNFSVEFAQGIPLLSSARWGYEVAVLHNRVILEKVWNGSLIRVQDRTVPHNTDPKTLSTTLTRQGPDLTIATKVVLRDDPQTVILSYTYTDHPGASAEPLAFISLGSGSLQGLGGWETVVDNLRCSRGPGPHALGIRGDGTTEAALTWASSDIVLESASVLGPWRPCPEAVKLVSGGYTCTVPAGDAARFFRPAMGYHISDAFAGGAFWNWETTAVVPDATLRPAWTVSGGRGRIYGAGTRNEDFTLRWGAGIWYRDCVSTVDIVDWGDAMDGASFGILLRAKPDTALWYSKTAGLPEQRYAGLLTFKKADNPAESALSITGPGGAVLKEQRFAAVNPDKQYRLRFWAVGDQLTLELFDLANPGTPIQTVAVTDGQVPEGMDGLYGTKSAGGTYEVWIDQFMLTGATVY